MATPIDENSPLLNNAADGKSSKPAVEEIEDGTTETPPPETAPKAVLGILSLLLIGVFVSQADTSLMLATYAEISSEFDRLENGSWLLTSYILAMCITQPLYGKLSDIFGRKALLQCAYILFFCGTIVCGLGQTMNMVIIGRAIQGTGGAGMVCMVSILLADIVPLRSVAAYRSYVNVVQTVGRSCGGAIGGYLAQKIGWRWTILGQCPFVFISILLVWWKLKESKRPALTPQEPAAKLSSKFRRIDFAGALSLSLTILSLLLLFELAADGKVERKYLICLAVATGIVALAFFTVENKLAKEPIFPLSLLGISSVITYYLILAIVNATQTSLMFLVPMYVQITERASTGTAGVYLIPAIIGNTLGGILTGIYIKRAGIYKLPTVLACISSALCFTLMICFWGRHINSIHACLISVAGLGTGIAHSAAFVGVTGAVEEDKTAIAGSGLYTMGSIGGVIGLAGTNTLFRLVLQRKLADGLSDIPDGSKVSLGRNPFRDTIS